ncbi:UbiA family prenyltransferase [Halobaculum sp. P14]|uniref:UbiA family prenyltransferase n=1 Tax=Halobaculum sp. P14 TaxID=3421638 RepID=UPI003EB7F3E3
MASEQKSVSVGSDDTAPWYSTVAASLLDAGDRTKRVLMYSTAYLVVIAAVEAALVVVGLSLPPSPAPLVVALLTFAVYAGDRIADVDADEATKPGQAAFVRAHKTAFSVLTAASYGLAITVSVTGGPDALVLALLPGAFWVLYASDWLPSLGAYFRRLKDVLVVNSVVVALAWALTLVMLPLAFADAAVTPAAAALFVYFLVDRFINTEIPNVTDRAGDEAVGVSTLPVVLGVRRTRQVLYVLTATLAGFLAAAYAAGLLPAALTAALLVGSAYTLAVTAAVGRTDKQTRLSVASEAKHLVVFAVLIITLTLGP